MFLLGIEEEGKDEDGSDGGGGGGKEIALALCFFPNLRAWKKQDTISILDPRKPMGLKYVELAEGEG